MVHDTASLTPAFFINVAIVQSITKVCNVLTKKSSKIN